MAKELSRGLSLMREVVNNPANSNLFTAPFLQSKSRESIPHHGDSRSSSPSPNHIISSSLYTLASDQSLLNSQLDRWLQSSINPPENVGLPRTRIPVSSRGTSPFDLPGICYLMALLLPIFSANNGVLRRCTPSAFIETIRLLSRNLSTMCFQARRNVRRFAEDQISRDLFATLLDVVLVIYAIGFLILSLYQAAVFA